MKIGILFDLDGTLLNTLEDLYNATNYILRRYGLPERTLEEIRCFVGNGARVLIAKALPGRKDDPPLEQVLADFQDYYNATCNDGTTKPYPGIPEALEKLRAQYPVAVVSNKPDPAVRELSGNTSAMCMPGASVRTAPESLPRIWSIRPWKPWAWKSASMWVTVRWMWQRQEMPGCPV